MKSKPITTEVGRIDGRNGIYLDNVQHCLEKGTLQFCGDINGNLCSANEAGFRWISYECDFLGVSAYQCVGLEECGWDIESSFDEVVESNYLTELGLSSTYKVYLFATYDYVFRIVAEDYEFRTLSGRSKDA